MSEAAPHEKVEPETSEEPVLYQTSSKSKKI